MIRFDAGTVLLQWSVGGLGFLWVTNRQRQVGLGYGWLIRILYGLMSIVALIMGLATGPKLVRDIATIAMIVGVASALVFSIVRRASGVARLPLWVDLLPPSTGLLALVAAGFDAGGPVSLALFRTFVAAAFLGAVSDAMLLGHWYLVQPGLDRQPLLELIRWTGLLWPLELAALLWPTGMLSVLVGTIDDGYGGLLGWFWLACTVASIALVVATRAALKERHYSAVMSATGLLYLAILTAFGMDLVARACLA